ncbi:unnamed protein product [Pleuronectes platessa]|uniref:Pentapeptide repeat-containing protein n=1 Tax=Pleuronectes platessa TaxID=8262 RepID=A0A9N7YDT3_PLEPL|nr:unnamed protein product [Pleuronectes platessa]
MFPIAARSRLLRHANIRRANIRHANIRNADIRRANIRANQLWLCFIIEPRLGRLAGDALRLAVGERAASSSPPVLPRLRKKKESKGQSTLDTRPGSSCHVTSIVQRSGHTTLAFSHYEVLWEKHSLPTCHWPEVY